MIHAFTSSGLLPQQYKYFTGAAGMGSLSPFYIHQIYNRYEYLPLVRAVAEDSMRSAVEQVKDDDNVWVMTDARHDSCVNAYHTTVPCIIGKTHRVAGIKTACVTNRACHCPDKRSDWYSRSFGRCTG
jgi:hypothetical protein